MSFVDITIRGLAFCRPVAATVTATHTTPAFTQILFPHPTGHNLELVITRSDVLKPKTEPIPITRFNTFMAMTLDGGANPDVPPSGGPIGNIVNIVDLHNEVSGEQPCLKFKSPDLTKLSISYLYLPTNALYSAAPSLDHEIWSRKTKKDTNPSRTYLKTLNGAQVAREILVRFKISPPGTVPPVPAVNLNMTKPFNQLYSFEYENGVDYTVLFDNDCHGHSCGNDFRFYYDMLTAMDDSYFDIKIEEFPIPDPGNPDSEAACNPVLGNTGRNLEHWYNEGNP